MAQYLNPDEFIKRLAASSGIEALGLVKGQEQMAQEKQEAQQQAMTQQLMGQAGSLAKSPVGEKLTEQMLNGQQQGQAPTAEAPPGPEA
jgi:hypothetical protein